MALRVVKQGTIDTTNIVYLGETIPVDKYMVKLGGTFGNGCNIVEKGTTSFKLTSNQYVTKAVYQVLAWN